MANTQQGFPQISAPFVNLPSGQINQTWLQLLISLWTRTGAQQGNISTFSPGDMKPFAGPVAPGGWLVCDGSAISRVAFATLFGVIGTTWGAGDGANTFNLPNASGRSLVGTGPGFTLGATGGSPIASLSIANLPIHNHGIIDPGHTHVVDDPGHIHAITDPGHTHTVTDPGHTHTVTDPGHNHTITDPQHHHTAANQATTGTAGTDNVGATEGVTGNSSTGITVNSHTTGVTINSDTTGITIASDTTGITINSHTTGVTNDSAFTGITTADTGGSTPIATLSPYAVVQWLIKT